MSKLLHHEIQERTKGRLLELGIGNHMFYGPTNDRYWDEPFRLVAVNMEPYGYEESGIFYVDREELLCWIYDAGKTRTRTTRYTLTLLSGILDHLHAGCAAVPDLFRATYQDGGKIEATLDRTVYYNIRPQSNSHKLQDFGAISSVGGTEFGRYVWDEIESLDPHVILVSGHAGLAALNQILKLNPPIRLRDSVVHHGILIQSISHPSRPSYDEWLSALSRIREWKETNV